MTTISQRRHYEPSWDQQHWRAELFRVYRRQRRYQYLIERDLRPDWLVIPGGASQSALYYHQLQRLADGADSPAALRNYLDKVRRTVLHPLGLVARGAPRTPPTPPAWACDHVHQDVCRGVAGAEEEYRYLEPADAMAYNKPGGEIRLTVFVTPWAADWSCVGPGGESGDRLGPLDAREPRDFYVGGRVDWEGLGGAVGKAVGQQLDAIKHRFEEAYPDQRNAAADRDWPLTLAALVGVLFLGERRPNPLTEKTEHDRLCRLARRVGTRYPPPAAPGKTRP